MNYQIIMIRGEGMLFPVDKIIWLNIAIIAVLLLSLYSGYRDGFIVKALGCLGFIVIGVTSWYIAPIVSDKINIFPESLTPLSGSFLGPYFYDTLNKYATFFCLFILLSLLILLIKPICKGIGSIPIIAEVNKLLGVLFGLLQGIILMIVITLVFRTPIFSNGNSVIEHSVLKTMNGLTDSVMFFLKDPMAEWESIQKLLTPSSELNADDLEKIKIWMREQNLDESQMQELLNQLRN